jgi:hypothetical protein
LPPQRAHTAVAADRLGLGAAPGRAKVEAVAGLAPAVQVAALVTGAEEEDPS